MKKNKILIIDDEENLCKIMKLNLEREGKYEVATAYSGEAGLKKAEKDDFDLIILDYKMPGMDGKVVLDALKEKKPPFPVVLFSIYHDDGTVIAKSIKRKADGLISKPIDFEQFHKVIKDVLAKKKKKGL